MKKETHDSLESLRFPHLKVTLWGAGQVFNKKISPVLTELGINDVEVFDPDQKKVFSKFKQINSPYDTGKDRVVFILSPNDTHASYALELLRKGRSFYVEKPCAINEREIILLDSEVAKETKPSYFADYYFFKALGLLSLMGVELPFTNRLRVQDPTGVLMTALNAKKSILGRVTKVEGFLLEGEGSAATLDEREWLADLKKGGGMLFDLMVHLTNLTNLMNLKIQQILSVSLSKNQGVRGRYEAIQKGDEESAEDWVNAKGIMSGGATFDFTVGKFAEKHNRYLLLEDENGFKLRLDFTSINPVILIDRKGNEIGRLTLHDDPYLLTMKQAINHLGGINNSAMFYEQQRESVLAIQRMHGVGRGLK